MLPKTTSLLFAPTKQVVEAHIVEWSTDISDQIHTDWWDDSDLITTAAFLQIDRKWNWDELAIEIDGQVIASTRAAIVTGDGAVQGAMMISTDAVPSILESGRTALFVELLFTAPRNRPMLRRDGGNYMIGVGQSLLAWGAELSVELGHAGRIRLDGSPEFLTWYEKRGLQRLSLKPNIFEGVSYMPMELTTTAAQSLMHA